MPLTTIEKRQLRDTIQRMQKTEQAEVLKIIIENEGRNKFTENINGCFVNITSLTENTVAKLKEFVDFRIKNNRDLDKTEEYINELKGETVNPVGE